MFDVDIEPVIHTGGDKLERDQKEQPGGNQGEGDKGDHQLGPQPGSQYPAPTLEDQLRQVAQHQKNYHQQEQKIEVDQDKDQKVAADRQIDLTEIKNQGLQPGQQPEEGQGGQHHPAQPSPPPAALPQFKLFVNIAWFDGMHGLPAA